MPLTVAEAKQFRRLIKKAGLEHWLPLLPPDLLPRKRGRRERASDTDAMLASHEIFVRTAMREHGMSRNAALHWAFDYACRRLNKCGSEFVFGPNANAIVARLSRKLRKGNYHKKDIRELLPPELLEAGIDPEKFTTIPPTKTDNSI
jgi:hypothetical protein